jgi:hypothetical protein
MKLLFDDRACRRCRRITGGPLFTELKLQRKRRNAMTEAIARIPQRHTIITDEDVARVAYFYWEHRGRPFGSPEVDWFSKKSLIWDLIKMAAYHSPIFI